MQHMPIVEPCWAACFYPSSPKIRLRKDKFLWQYFKKISSTLTCYIAHQILKWHRKVILKRKWTNYYIHYMSLNALLNFWDFYDRFFLMTGFIGIIIIMSNSRDRVFMEIDFYGKILIFCSFCKTPKEFMTLLNIRILKALPQ